MPTNNLWNRFRKQLVRCPGLEMTLDISRMDFPRDFFSQTQPAIEQAYHDMDKLEAGHIANPDENRMVGHYWLRNPDLAPDDNIRNQIRQAVEDVKQFTAQVHNRKIKPPHAARFSDALLIGIGGSALGPQLVADALAGKRDKMRIHFIDNTDPDGIQRLVARLHTRLRATLVIVVSKSGGTPETRNGMLEIKRAFERLGLDLTKQAVAVTGENSRLDQQAQSENWLARFPMWDWVGGRTSVTSAVGLLPAALQGIDIDSFLRGAADMDKLTRQHNTNTNPAARMALMWHFATEGRGQRDMVILPYKDRLLLLSRYLQQLVMESLGKEKDLDGNTVHQGLTVYGNKGSTDQHAFVQQLRDGLDNFFATFIIVMQDTQRPGDEKIHVEPDITTGDYLLGLWQGTRQALHDNGRGSITLTLEKVDALRLGALIALFERAVGLYASLININAYHQPGVEAGKKAAASVLKLQQQLIAHLEQNPGDQHTAQQLAEQLGQPDEVETIHHLLEHLAANKRCVTRNRSRFRTI